MGILESIGLSKRKARPVGQELESGRTDKESEARRHWLVRGGMFLALIVVTVLAFPRGEVYEYTVEVGDTWRQPTLVASFNFPIRKDASRVDRERQEARRETPPYFQELPNAQSKMAANRDTLRQQLDRILEAYADYRFHSTRNRPDAAQADSLRYVELRRNALVTLTPGQWRILTDSYVRQIPELSDTARQPATEERLDLQLLEDAFRLGTQLLRVGVMNQSRDSIYTDNIIIRNEEESVQRSVSKDNVYGLNEAYDYARKQFDQAYPNDETRASLTYAFFRDIFQTSLRYMRAETIRERDRRASEVTAYVGGVREGEVIVQKGERITDEIKRKLTSLEREKNERTAGQLPWWQLLGETIFALLTFLFFFYYLYQIRREVWDDQRDMLLISITLLAIIALFGVAVRIPWAHLYAVPIALAAVMLTIIFNSTIGLFSTLVLALVGGQMVGLDLEFTFASFIAGALGVFSVRDIKNRGQFVLSAGLVFLGYVLVIVGTYLYLGTPTERLGRELSYAAVGSSFTITAYLVLWILERTFDVTTDLTLLELSDTNRPLLKDLSLKAPGSFNHSLQVANLAEAAADRIGANALLTRVGALYHDIGKMKKPEYFVENQRAGANPHDKLKPRMSALIIASHVKEGLDLAKKSNLPERVKNFIPTHHGTARIEYFYRKAVEQTGPEDSPVLESEFRYPGPRPNSKETGILMLSDSVEAASRSLDDPTHNRLKSLIDLIFKERIEDGQLDDTGLTFRDLRQIKDTFLQMLLGIYHVRVKYPDQEEEMEDDSRPVVSAPEEIDEETYKSVSILWDKDVIGPPEQSVSSDRLRGLPGVRETRAPRPDLAEASPHHRSTRPRPDRPLSNGDRLTDSKDESNDGAAGGSSEETNRTASGDGATPNAPTEASTDANETAAPAADHEEGSDDANTPSA
ncbi:metal-dependent phosphohydrolase [Longibacter salinarum]|uniref:Metal-dependent phosphohydrolase n=1 Tax=Longibacter salinarum TaxID=1850348 RepID=A0A2A8D253_9BACT|nr:HDIG domain-containing metalloprotein [Longibacter salinarum]PEN15052.1 metal-dependent phosphohydrolase [Longibacter salinarum]